LYSFGVIQLVTKVICVGTGIWRCRYKEIEDKISKLIQVTKSEVIRDFFVESASKEKSITNKRKYQHFDTVLEMKMFHESQIEAQEEYQMN
jgi:RNA polymerase-interacting CarD/CdnL/TRCF family regulator